MRAELLERYQALPLPTKSDEHWRFTDLAGFDPESFTAVGGPDVAVPATMLELDVSGLAFVGEAGMTIEQAMTFAEQAFNDAVAADVAAVEVALTKGASKAD